jgi:hypothetical protein
VNTCHKTFFHFVERPQRHLSPTFPEVCPCSKALVAFPLHCMPALDFKVPDFLHNALFPTFCTMLCSRLFAQCESLWAAIVLQKGPLKLLKLFMGQIIKSLLSRCINKTSAF